MKALYLCALLLGFSGVAQADDLLGVNRTVQPYYGGDRDPGVGRRDPSPSSPSVSGYTRDGKTTSTITGERFGDQRPSGGNNPISTPAR
jgi:hypothetical protein